MTGVLPVDKPAGPTSHDVVAAVRRTLDTRKVGHTGTLDPFATGLLIVAIGSATRLAQYFSDFEKEYEATARLGVSTDTLDLTGTVEAETDTWQALDAVEIRAAFEDQRGRREQRPPAYSAKRVGGKKSYELARVGRAVELAPVEVTIRSMEVLDIDGADVRFRLHCASGTYVRAVARDAGDTLGVGAHLTALRRTGVGPFHVADAVPYDRLDDPAAVDTALLSPLDAVGHLPRLTLGPEQLERVRHGQSIEMPGFERGLVAMVEGGVLRAVAESNGRWVRPRKVFS